MDSVAVIWKIEADGWRLVRVKGSHHHFVHPSKPGVVTVVHPLKDIPKGTLGSIQRQAQTKLRD
jgi:predicted RNA binding protein YcfA (HicA-like mRNA interferase family)